MHVKPHWLLLILWLLTTATYGQETFTLTADGLQNGQAVELDKLNWKYAPGDEPRFAEPQFDDRAWETLNGTAITLDRIPQSGWRGIGWFRLRMKVDPAIANQPLNLAVYQYGACEIYLDGRLIQTYGRVSGTRAGEEQYNPNASPLGIVFDARPVHLLAIRYSNQVANDLSSGFGRWWAEQPIPFLPGVGFRMRVTQFSNASNQSSVILTAHDNLLAGAVALFAFGVLHLLFYVLYPRQWISLICGLAFIANGSNSIGILTLQQSHYGAIGAYWTIVLNQTVGILSDVMLLAYVYLAFYKRIPRQFWLIFIGFAIVIGRFLFLPSGDYLYTALEFLTGIEMIRVTAQAIHKRLPDAWIVGAGVGLYSLGPMREALNTVLPLPPAWYFAIGNLSIYSILILFTLYLARDFARTNRTLEKQLIQVKQLSAAALEHEKVKAENDRRAKELEEARQLQLSMLPKKLPNLPHLDIAAYMKTASEVGGDYYDFHTGEDGTLTIAVGDATGHGLKAGTMVTAVKALFDTLAYHPDIPHIFERLTRTLKRMNLRGLFMAMTVAKINHHRLVVSIAGMPPVLLYRAANGAVEEVQLKALPLGGIANYAYQQLSYEMAAGDVIVLMSDGLPERFNAQREMLGDEAATQRLAEVGQGSAQEILNHLVALGEDWGGAHPPDDDVTFVVVKVK